MFERLEKIADRYNELSQRMMDPETMQSPAKYATLAKEKRSLDKTIEKYRAYKKLLATIADDESVLETEEDEELRGLAESELEELYPRKEEIEDELKLLLLPRDPNDSKNAIVEIRAGTGGEEAGIFAGDLFRMYTRFAERQGWTLEFLSSNPQGIGGFKEVIFMLKGEDGYGQMKYESGVHRVQRVPKTEASGRIHTSAASVAVLPEADEVEIQIVHPAREGKASILRIRP
jgi:peptide chain release factor 1